LDNSKDCNDCPTVSISIPQANETSKVAKNINAALQQEIITELLFEEQQSASSLENALHSFKEGYQKMKFTFNSPTPKWEAEFNAKIIYEDAALLTIELNSYMFTGGAHGYTSKHFLNFNKTKGTKLANWQLFKNAKKFKEFAEARFREQEAIPKNKPINYTGLMFEKNSFYLPENIGFTKHGIQLLYNPYELTSYPEGLITLTLKYKTVKPFLATKTKS